MSRKPYPKYKLTTDEYNVIDKLADKMKCGWFSIAGTWMDGRGKPYPMKCKKYGYDSETSDFDICYDLEMRHFVSLQYGIRNLNYAFEADEPLNSTFITTDELNTYKGLVKKLNII